MDNLPGPGRRPERCRYCWDYKKTTQQEGRVGDSAMAQRRLPRRVSHDTCSLVTNT